MPSSRCSDGGTRFVGHTRSSIGLLEPSGLSGGKTTARIALRPRFLHAHLGGGLRRGDRRRDHPGPGIVHRVRGSDLL